MDTSPPLPMSTQRDRFLTPEEYLAIERAAETKSEYFAKLVVEPSGAVPVAALVAAGDEFRGARIGVILSGGNVDLATACALFGG